LNQMSRCSKNILLLGVVDEMMCHPVPVGLENANAHRTR